MFLLPDYIPVDELSIGDTKMRLVETAKKNQYIQLYSSLSKQWNIMYKTNVEQFLLSLLSPYLSSEFESNDISH